MEWAAWAAWACKFIVKRPAGGVANPGRGGATVCRIRAYPANRCTTNSAIPDSIRGTAETKNPHGVCFAGFFVLGSMGVLFATTKKTNMTNSSLITQNPLLMSGAPCFAGTRVPVKSLFDYLEAGESIDDFLEGFPSVTREHVIAFLEEAKDRVIEAAS